MSWIAGIDYSTHAIDVVLIDENDELAPVWLRTPLEGGDAFERTRSLQHRYLLHQYDWDDVLAVGIEEPAGVNPGRVFRVQGAILHHIPQDKLATTWMPSQWRKVVGLPGNASKGHVKAVAIADAIRSWGKPVDWGPPIRRTYPDWIDEWPQDAWDAYCIALATKHAITREEASS